VTVKRRALFYSPAKIVGGAEKYLSWILPRFVASHHVALVCPPDPALDEWVADLRRHGVAVYRYDTGSVVGRMRSVVQLVWLMRRADVVHLNLIKPPAVPWVSVLGWLLRVPRRVGTQHLVLKPVQMSRYRLKRWWPWLLSCIHRFTLHKVISPSFYSGDVLTSCYGFPRSHVEVISHGVDLQKRAFNTEPRPRPDPGTSEVPWPVVGCVGYVCERKGQYLIIEALPSLLRTFPRLRVILVGGGADIPVLAKWARELGVDGHVTFCGAQDDVDPLFQQMDAFVLPSSAEGLPIAPIEALAHGLPVIATDIPPLREVLAATGIFLKTRSADAIADAIIQLFATAHPQRIGAAARERALCEFGLQHMVEETSRVFVLEAKGSVTR
jgi:glycosyltransferase involved in cell wall biosynthesis